MLLYNAAPNLYKICLYSESISCEGKELYFVYRLAEDLYPWRVIFRFLCYRVPLQCWHTPLLINICQQRFLFPFPPQTLLSARPGLSFTLSASFKFKTASAIWEKRNRCGGAWIAHYTVTESKLKVFQYKEFYQQIGYLG